VSRPEGHALTDMYFPQLMLHVEIDEPFHEKQIELDINRETDIIQATNHEIHRIEIIEDLDSINKHIEDLVNLMRKKIADLEKNNSWEAWDIEKEFSPDYYKEKGYLDVKENPAFRRIVDACNCLGQNYEGAQRAVYEAKLYPNHYLWFPKFYKNDEWDNRISEDRSTIIVKCKNPTKQEKGFRDDKFYLAKKITFPRSKDNLGNILYRFAGIFETDMVESSIQNGVVHRLKKTRMEL